MPRSPARGDLHGNAPDESRVALIVYLGAQTLVLTGAAGNFCALFDFAALTGYGSSCL